MSRRTPTLRTVAALFAVWVGALGAATGALARDPRTAVETIEDPRTWTEPGLLVTWIEHHSGFREAGLEIGDRIVAVNGAPPPETETGPVLFGPTTSEDSYWYDQGFAAGDTVTFTVARDDATVEISAALTEEDATVRGEDGRRRFGADGPPERDDELGAIDYAYRQFHDRFAYLLRPLAWSEFDRTVGKHPMGFALRDLEEAASTARAVRESYPGPFADHWNELVDAALARVEGEPRALSDEDLEWRRLGEQRAAELAAAADAAFDAFMAERADDVRAEPFPAPDPTADPIDDFVGKVVVMEPAGERDLSFEAGEAVVGETDDGRVIAVDKSYFRHDGRGGLYFTPRHDVRVWALYDAVASYTELATPLDRRNAEIRIVGRVGEDPVLVADSVGRTDFGLQLEPLAAMVADSRDPGHRFFVDLTGVSGIGDTAAIAGADALTAFELRPHDADMSPSEAVERFVNAAKYGDFDAWAGMFADWEVQERRSQDGGLESRLYDAWLDDQRLESFWLATRRAMLDADHVESQNVAPSMIYDVEIVSETPVREVHSGATRFRGLDRFDIPPTTIEEAGVVVRYVGDFDGEFRTFTTRATLGYNTFIRVQRRDGGPWKIVELDAL